MTVAAPLGALARAVLGAALLAACSGGGDEPAPRSGSGSARVSSAPRPQVPGELTGSPAAPRPSAAAPGQGAPAASSAFAVTPPPGSGSAAPAGAPAPPAWDGDWLAVTAVAAAVYPEARADQKKKLGYVRNGGRVAVRAVSSRAGCSAGWRELVTGGFVCGNHGTTELGHPEVQFALKAPNLDDVLPYTYARNAKHGTPLYKSVPSREQMRSYEPYLEPGRKAVDEDDEGDDEDHGDDDKPRPAARGAASAAASAERRPTGSAERAAPAAASASPTGAAGAALPSASALPALALPAASGAGALPSLPPAGSAEPPEPERPWWQTDGKDPPKVTLEQLTAESDDVLARRMVAGFYVAVDRTFSWSGRTWYKTTKGLVAPADRMWATAGSKFSGVELDDAGFRLPVAFTYGQRKSTPSYTLDEAAQRSKPARTLEQYAALQLTGREAEVGGTRFLETAGEVWVKAAHVRVARAPESLPAELGPEERWFDVNLTTQTLVAFQGKRPVFATLVSSGKESKVKEKDHRTPRGEWRVREKHVTTTMDGNGVAAGDLPYSIEDVPFVLYYHQSYALHAAFWHRNFGTQMSHGCVNLAPLDAKRLFFFADPPIPAGYHGVWSSPERPGSRVVVHE